MARDFVDVNGNSIELEMAVDKVTPGLMSNEDKIKLDGIEAGANRYVQPTSFPATMITEDTGHKFITEAERTAWNAKASNIVASQTINGLMSATDKIKLDGIETGANNYTHPATHAATMIVEDTSHRFITDAERTAWNAKANSTVATVSANGLMSATDKIKLDGIAAGANNYTHPATHDATMIVEDETHRFMTDVERAKLNGIATGANNYVHPTTHPPTIIAQDASNRFVTDTEKSTWNSKASSAVATTSANGLMSSTDKIKLDGIDANANAYTHPATHAATMIVEDTSHKFVTDTQISTWNAKAPNTAVTTTANGLMLYTDKVKLDGIAANANAYTHPSTHPASIIVQDSSNRFVTDTEKSTWNAKASTSVATTSANGLMSASDKTKLDGIATGATKITVDTAMSSTSTNPVQNKVVNTALAGKAASSHEHSAANITSGTLAVARGGTGTTSTSGIKSAIGLGNLGLACCAESSAGTSVSLPADTITKVTLSSFTANTDSSTFEISNGGVKCNKAGTVLITGSVYINTTSVETVTGCYLKKGSTEIQSQFILQYASGAISSGMKIITVAAGDIIYLNARSYTATTFNANVDSTNLCITYLK